MNTEMTADLAYGKERFPLVLERGLAEWHVIRPTQEPPLAEAREAFRTACRNPIGSPPLRDVVKPGERVAIVTSDGTRPAPNRILLPWLIEELGVPLEDITVLIGTGTHRANTEDELEDMFGADLRRQLRIVNHDAFDSARNVHVGEAAGVPVFLDEAYVRADKRIVLGFIEPHFFAGFSGGPKAVVPGLASIDTIFQVHCYDLIADARSTWGLLDENPVHRAIADMVALCPPDFLVNVTLNNAKAITGLFAGDYREAHRVGCAHVREHAMAAVPHAFPIVVTSNSGYPLDQNLYQSVKGMSAAARIVQDNGAILIASECSDGIPAHGNFGAVLARHANVESIEAWLRGLAAPVLDQWQIQLLVKILQHCRLSLYSALDPECVRACKLSPVASLEDALRAEIARIGKGAPVAVLPEGPVTIPYVAIGSGTGRVTVPLPHPRT
jgi:nickel-dependent lactate racemase